MKLTNERFNSRIALYINKSAETLKDSFADDFEEISPHDMVQQLPVIIEKINTHSPDLNELDYKLLCYALLNHLEDLKEEIEFKKNNDNKIRKYTPIDKKIAEELFFQFSDMFY